MEGQARERPAIWADPKEHDPPKENGKTVIIDATSRRPLRTVAASIPLALIVALPVLSAGPAHAASPNALLGISMSTAHHGVDLQVGVPYDAEYWTDAKIERGGANSTWSFGINPQTNDGRFAIRNDSLTACLDFNTDNNHVVENSCDWKNSKQNWYAQPSDIGGDYFVIRNVNNDKCMATVGGTDNPVVGLEDCAKGDKEQAWLMSSKSGSESPQPMLSELAVKYGLSQFDRKSSVIKSATYEVTGETTAKLGNYENVTVGGVTENLTTEIMDAAVAWAQTTGTTYTVGGDVTYTTGASMGFELGPVKATVQSSLAVGVNWSTATRQDQTLTSTRTIHIKPGTYGWIMRAQLEKTVRGPWTITNDMGTTWTGLGTATVPVEKVDGMESKVTGCTSDSKDPICTKSDPGKP
ncbi:RICIN domain-containing protein [Streptomyces sp. NPDC048637]|uniref:RICIN domain-containing protein n=1 Tax=Streptomyces sp. NPDC048637 TaxID=3155636 RepID=UPI003430C10A